MYSSFRFGFDIHFSGTPSSNAQIKNLTSARQNPDILKKLILEEVRLGRIVGPFPSPPFVHFQVNPVGLVPKKELGAFRMIVDMSNPPGSSINDFIEDEFATVSYASFKEAIKMIIECGKGAYMCKTDIKSAFRLLPLHPDLYHISLIKCADQFYVDRCLAMGTRSSCNLFEKVSCALQFIAQKKGIQFITHLLDDFFMMNKSRDENNKDLTIFQSVCHEVGAPLVPEKTFLPAQKQIYYGFEIDTLREEIRLPTDKLEKCKNLIKQFLVKPKCTLQELQQLLGLLNWATTVIVAGRVFLRRLYRRTAGIKKSYHFIRLRVEDKEDLKIWLHFLDNYNGVTLYREELFLSHVNQHIYTDASSLGYGAIFDKKWFACSWPNSWWPLQNITLLELIPVVLATQVWATSFRNKCVTLHTDNHALVFMINNQSSNEDLVMTLLRSMTLNALQNNFLIKAVHVPGVDNSLADCLSRLQVTRFKQMYPEADSHQTKVTQLPPYLC